MYAMLNAPLSAESSQRTRQRAGKKKPQTSLASALLSSQQIAERKAAQAYIRESRKDSFQHRPVEPYAEALS